MVRIWQYALLFVCVCVKVYACVLILGQFLEKMLYTQKIERYHTEKFKEVSSYNSSRLLSYACALMTGIPSCGPIGFWWLDWRMFGTSATLWHSSSFALAASPLGQSGISDCTFTWFTKEFLWAKRRIMPRVLLLNCAQSTKTRRNQLGMSIVLVIW